MGLSREVMGAMRDHQVPLSTLSFCILIKGHGRNGDARRVKAAYEGMRTLGITPDLATINALVDAHVRTRRLPDAERLVAEMEAIHGVSPSARTFNTLLKGYALAGDMARAFATVRRLREAVGPGGPNEVTYSTLVHALVRTGDLRRARHLVTWMAKSDTPLAPDVYAYTALMRGLLEGRSAEEEAAAAAEDADGAAAAATDARAEAAADEVEGGEEHDGAGGDPAAPRPSPPMDGVGEALGLLEEMLAFGVTPNEATVSTLIGGCFDRDNATAARLAAAAVRAHADTLPDARRLGGTPSPR